MEAERRLDGKCKLSRHELGGVIFCCSNYTIDECLSHLVFGLPECHFSYVQYIKPGMPIFLFNYSDRTLHGIYEAVSHGRMYIRPYGWTKNSSEVTQYPAQVKVRISRQCHFLLEKQFRKVLHENYNSKVHFQFELDERQTRKLLSLFESPVWLKDRTGAGMISGINANAPICNLSKKELGGVICGCTNKTMDECLAHLVFGLPEGHFSYVRNIEPGLLIFLFNYDDRTLHGIYEAVSHGRMYIKPSGWTENGSDLTQYPAQVHVRIWKQCQSLLEEQFQMVLHENYYGKVAFHFELDRRQTSQLLSLFISPTLSRSSPTFHSHTSSWRTPEKAVPTLHSGQNPFSVPPGLTGPGTPLQMWNNSHNNQQLVDPCQELSSGFDKLIFVTGGYDGLSWLPTLECYSPFTDSVRSLKPMSVVRSCASAVLLNGLIYIFGGWNGNHNLWYDTVECYDPVSNEWISCPPLSKERGCHAGVSLHNKIFAVGGGNDKDCFNDVDIFDPVAGRWIPTCSMLEKRFACAAAELDSVLYVVGGYDGKNYLKSAERFDFREPSWSILQSMNTSRGSHALTAFNGKLYSMGGFDGSRYVPSVEAFDPRMGLWLACNEMEQSRGYFAAPVTGEAIYVLGGQKEENNILDSVERYTLDHGWSVTSLKGFGKKCFFSSVVY